MKIWARMFSVLIAGISLGCGLAGQSIAAELSESHKGGCAPRTIHRTYIRRDVVEPGVYEVRRVPAQYGWVVSGGGEPRRILLRPYKNIAHFERPYISWYREHLTIVPEPDC
jgi:hypothetical protein